MTDQYKRVYAIGNRYPDVALTVLMSAFSMAAFEDAEEVRIKHVYKAIVRTKNIYEDAKVKELERFKTVFADLIKEENMSFDVK